VVVINDWDDLCHVTVGWFFGIFFLLVFYLYLLKDGTVERGEEGEEEKEEKGI